MASVSKSKTSKLGWGVRLVFGITLHIKDEEIIHRIKRDFGSIGDIGYKDSYVTFRVTRLEDIYNIIYSHYVNYPLQTTKTLYFNL